MGRMRFIKHVSFFIFAAGFAFVIITVSIFYFGGNEAHAAPQELHGWAWSSNIGWVSVNCEVTSGPGCTDYQVILESTTGNISGYAWSSSIGWINFAPDLLTAPDGAGPAHVAGSGAVTGWIRACSVFVSGCSGGLKGTAERGGWDGWIKMSGTNQTSPNLTGNGGVTYDAIDGRIIGFAWGGDVMGWLRFCAANETDFCVTISSLPPDLDVTAGPSVKSGSLVTGSLVTFQGTITNIGGSTAGGTFTNRFLIDLNSSTFVTADVIRSGDSITALASGASSVVDSDASSWTAVVGTHTIRLLADDPSSVAESNEANNWNDWTFTVIAANAPPVANAGPDQSPTVGSPYSHTGGLVTDSNGNLASYDWNFDSCVDFASNPIACPPNPAPVTGLTGGGPTSAPLTYTPTVAGIYTLRLTVTDAGALTGTDTAVDTAGVAGGSFTLSATPSTITIDASSFFYSFSSRSEITVIPAGGYSGNVQLSVAGVSPAVPVGFLDLYTPNNVISLAEYGGGTFFKARVETSVADPNVNKTFIITLRGVDTGNPAITDDVDVTLIIRASDPGGGEQ